MNTYTTHTAREMARPSRLDIMRARASHWCDEHTHAIGVAVTCAVAVFGASFVALLSFVDGESLASAVTAAMLIVGVSCTVGMVSHMVGETRGEELASDADARLVRTITLDMGDEIARLTRERDEARATVARYASALVDMALDDDDDDEMLDLNERVIREMLAHDKNMR